MADPLPRRIAAIVLPELALELGRARRRRGDRDGPFAVVVADAPGAPAVEGNAVLAAVDVRAYRCGVRPGQSVAQAAAFVGKLEVAVVAPRAIEQALAAVAEVALAFGTTAALERTPAPAALSSAWGGAGAGPWSTVWLDVTGCARLVGGEDVLASELRQAAEELGHGARTALADGPRLAQIAARFLRVSVVPAGEGAAALAPVPVSALPLEEATLGWLGKLGLLSCGDLARLEPSRLAQRLGPRAAEVCALLEGRDTLPLVAYEPPPRIVETACFEDAVDAVEPLLFCTSGLVARAAVRLAARGRAAGRLALVLHGDPHLAALEAARVAADASTPGADAGHAGARHLLELVLDPPVPLRHPDDMLRALRARLEGLSLATPVHALDLVLERLTTATRTQLELGRRGGRSADPEALGALSAELAAGLGPDRVGVLALGDSHRPEARSRLVPCKPAPTPRARLTAPAPRPAPAPAPAPPPDEPLPEPTRLLPEPCALGEALRPGALVAVGHTLYAVDALRLCARLDGVEWWTRAPATRDYARVWLHTDAAERTARPALAPPTRHAGVETDATAHVCALVFREHGRWWLHGWYD